MQFLKIAILFIIVAGVIVYAVSQAPFLKDKIDLFSFKPIRFSPKAPAYKAPETEPSVPSVQEQIEEIPDYKIPAGFTREKLSSYFEKIQISSVSVYSYGNNPKSIQLYSYPKKDESINISGWKIKGNRYEFIIPQAIKIYNPESDNKEEDIVLSGSNYLIFYSSKSPFSRNLRLNKCSGYLNNFYDFNPDLPNNCPGIERSEYSGFSGQCQSYLMSLGRCKMPDVNFYNSLPGTDQGNACRAFLNTISHAACFKKYSQDNDFLSNEWRIWINEDFRFDSSHDRLFLFDKEELLVDEYIY
ncbi:MAG: hypothetical protein AAB464_00295 [Patescibacteria group bacterium]